MNGADACLADADAVAARLATHLPAPLVPLFDAGFIRSSRLYEEFIHRLTLQVCREVGLETAAREAGSADEIAARAGLQRDRAQIPLDWSLRALAARALAAVEGSGDRRRFRLLGGLPELDPAGVREEQRRHDPSWLPSYTLAETAAASFPAFLRGDVTAEQVLFSPARFRLWLDYFSNDNGLYAVNNRVAAIAAEAWAARPDAAILELGGGLGSAAEALLDRFAGAERLGHVRSYRFTELVPAFLRRGQSLLEKRFPPASAFLAFGALDMNRPFAEQGVTAGSFTLVYAVNSLHVADDLGFTLGEIVRALEPGGQLVIGECVRPRPGQPVYVEFVFNLMETFRAPRLHPEYRPNGGFLTTEQWQRAMEIAGFTDVRVFPEIARLRDDFPAFHVAAIGAIRRA